MSLKEQFNISESHELKQTSYKAKGGMAQNEYWTYAVLNESGEQIAKIDHWETMSGLKVKSGYRKYDMSGKLLEEKI